MSACIVSFSSRADGNCARIARLIRSLTEDAVLFCFADFEIHPCGKCGYECFASRDACPFAGDMERPLLDAVTHSERAYFVLPNYCDYPCANYYIFNERSQCFFQGRPELLAAYESVPKRFVVVSNTNEENFRQALAYQAARPPEILFLSAKRFGKSSIRGDLLSEPKAVDAVTAFVSRAW